MNELKYYKLFHRTSALTSPEFISVVEFGKDEEVYLKSEADKVIAELKEKLDLYKRGFTKNDKIIAHLCAELRNQKYKRCLAMERWCEATALWCYQAANTLPKGFKATLFGKPVMIEPNRLYNRFLLLCKWSNRWMNIGKKFKEVDK